MNNQLSLAADKLPLISHCDIVKCEEGFIHPDRIMDVNVLLYVYEGSFQIFEEDPSKQTITEYTIKSGQLLFLKQNFHHYGKICLTCDGKQVFKTNELNDAESNFK